MKKAIASAIVCVMASTTLARAAEPAGDAGTLWPQWRGPSGDGAVIRLNVSVTGSGTSALTISSPLLLDVNGTDTTGSFTYQNGEVRVGSSCPAPPVANTR